MPVHQFAEGLGVAGACPFHQDAIGHTQIRGAGAPDGWEKEAGADGGERGNPAI
jgi:hypothetical protein